MKKKNLKNKFLLIFNYIKNNILLHQSSIISSKSFSFGRKLEPISDNNIVNDKIMIDFVRREDYISGIFETSNS